MRDFPKTSHSLIARLQQVGDGASWSEFLEIYQPIVFRMVRRRGLQEADVEDVVQQIFLSVSRSIDDWTAAEQPPFRAWLTTVTRNATLKALTRQPRDRATGSDSIAVKLAAQVAPEPTVSEILLEERQEVVRWAIEQIRNKFSPSTWQLFWETTFEGATVEEVAQATGRSPGAIYVARYRVISQLKAKVAEVLDNWDFSSP